MLDSFNQKIYGKPQLEPVIIDLINSKPVQRLKHICQHGPDRLVWPHANITRYDHSLGVFLLLRKFNAPLPEQIAGLIHDVSHGVFSHAIDFVFGSQIAANFQDSIHEKFLLKSEIPKILKSHGLNIDSLLDYQQFPLLEQPIPDLCADRVDYLCRDSYHYGQITIDDTIKVFNSLADHNGQIVCANLDTANFMGQLFINASSSTFAGPLTVFFHTKIAEAIKIALESGVISTEDLFTTDSEVLDKLSKSSNHQILACLKLISPKTTLISDQTNFDLHLRVKSRYIDPKVLVDGKAISLSKLDPNYKSRLEHSKSNQSKGHFVRIISC